MVESTEEKVISEIKRLIRQHTYCSYRDEEELCDGNLCRLPGRGRNRYHYSMVPIGKTVGRILGIA